MVDNSINSENVNAKYLADSLKSIFGLDEKEIQNSQDQDINDLEFISANSNLKTKVSNQIGSKNLNEILEELNCLIGLGKVKNEINTLVNYINIQKTRGEVGLKISFTSYHMVFTGNPGTGKTTVARIVARIFQFLGFLNSGHLIETDSSGLIAEYVGQTAVKVNKIVDSALNGVLFIDEAYSIFSDGNNEFGKEAIATLIKRMEDDRDKLVVILAGYTKEMNEFIEANPGLKSRFNRYIEFDDYTPNELLSIYKSQCHTLDYKLTSGGQIKLLELFRKSYLERDYTFGNGRFVRNIFEQSVENQANRLSKSANLDHDTLMIITEEDIPLA